MNPSMTIYFPQNALVSWFTVWGVCFQLDITLFIDYISKYLSCQEISGDIKTIGMFCTTESCTKYQRIGRIWGATTSLMLLCKLVKKVSNCCAVRTTSRTTSQLPSPRWQKRVSNASFTSSRKCLQPCNFRHLNSLLCLGVSHRVVNLL